MGEKYIVLHDFWYTFQGDKEETFYKASNKPIELKGWKKKFVDSAIATGLIEPLRDKIDDSSGGKTEQEKP